MCFCDSGVCMACSLLIDCVVCFCFFFFFFFFQAEDGIRDLTVTGVQTCALPISTRRPARGGSQHGAEPCRQDVEVGEVHRSEERRVGKSVDLGGRRIIKKKKKKKRKKSNRKKKKRTQETYLSTRKTPMI